MRFRTKMILGAILAVFVLIGAGTVMSKAGIDTPVNNIADSVSNSIANGIIDAADLKGKAQSALESNATSISQATGLPTSAVQGMIADLGIKDWTVTSLPANATEVDSGTFSYGGETVSVKSYNDPGIVTLGYKGAEVTFAIPESAQGYIKYLEYLP